METTQTNTEQLQDYLQKLATLRAVGTRPLTGNPYEVLLQDGRGFPAADKPAGVRWGVRKQCYSNAGRLALGDRTLVYCEGYAVAALAAIIPLQHAWVWDLQAGRIIDNTWREGGLAYWGIPFRRGFLAKEVLRQGSWGGLIFNERLITATDKTEYLHEITD